LTRVDYEDIKYLLFSYKEATMEFSLKDGWVNTDHRPFKDRGYTIVFYQKPTKFRESELHAVRLVFMDKHPTITGYGSTPSSALEDAKSSKDFLEWEF
jgi:hypothetical protein